MMVVAAVRPLDIHEQTVVHQRVALEEATVASYGVK